MSLFPTNNSIIQDVALAGQAILPLVSIVAAIIAFRAIQAQKESNARRIYFDYVKVAFENHALAFPKNTNVDFDHRKGTIDGDRQKYEQYEWFVSLLVVSAEGILDIVGSTSAWHRSAVTQLSYHRDYFERNMSKRWLQDKFKAHREIAAMLERPVNA